MTGILVDWNSILRSPVKVRFNSLVIPEERLPFEKSVAQMDLADRTKLDIAWAGRKARYVLTLYRDNYHQPISRVEVSRPEQVVDRVRSIVDGDNVATLYGESAGYGLTGTRLICRVVGANVDYHNSIHRGVREVCSVQDRSVSNTNMSILKLVPLAAAKTSKKAHLQV
jgi:hypothetical protein